MKNIRNTEYGLVGEMYFSLFDRNIEVSIDDELMIEYANICAEYLNSLNDEVINQFCLAAIRYCNEFLSDIGEDEIGFNKPSDVLTLIKPKSLTVPDPQNGLEPVIDMELDCEWEEEHGMELIIRNDTVLYVGAYYGENPWGDYTNKKSWNYA
ncbi:hypothetical protein BC351_00865 [Paenibacillus ferrarius]|uniref:DUF6985 domain-containing protein n=1 Tax=Paenibacillus ferrarius TaxID=1469647 RepID=A0A1V4HTR6_9BACL|nr:hypothetical protein BC351_00865 [Paenibacillus ferrarius]